MTACVNKNHGRRVAGVVTASLVGALTLGGVSLAAVPTVALAEQGSLQAAWYTNTTVTRATDGQGGVVSDPANASFATGSGKFLVPTEVSNGFDTTDVTKAGYRFEYFKADGTGFGRDTDFTLGADADANAAVIAKVSAWFKANAKDGSYYVVISKDGEQTGKLYFKLADTLFDGVKPAKDYTYNGTRQTVKFVNAAGDDVTSYVSSGNEVIDAGDYVATLENSATGKKVNVDYSVAKLDLSKAGLTFDDVLSASDLPHSVASDYGADFLGKLDDQNGTELSTVLEVTSVSNTDGTTDFGAKGAYTVKVKATGDDMGLNPNFKNVADSSATITFTYADVDLFHNGPDSASVYYGNKVAGTQLTFNSADGESYDAAKLTVGYEDGSKVDPSMYAVSYYKKQSDGSLKKVEASELAKNGEYVIRVKAVAYQGNDGKWVAGKADDITVKVDASLVLDANANLAFYLDGEAVDGNSGNVAYDGSDASKAVTAAVKDGSGRTLEAGKDYQLALTDAKGKEVDSAVNAGEYKVTVKPLTFKWKSGTAAKATFALTVEQAKLFTPKSFVATETQGSAGSYRLKGDVIAYTGSDVATPAATFQKVDRKNAKVWDDAANTIPSYGDALSSDLYTVISLTYSETDPNVAGGKNVTKAKDAGYYKVKVALTDKASNYQLVNDTYIFRVISLKPFADVQSPSWYAKGVATAKSNRYVNGISGTQLFSPEAKITRADATVILFNMAGGSTKFGDDQFQYNELAGFNTGFSDVDGKAYYAKAIAWAKAAGVATGDAGTTNFRPTDQITRQEFAALLVKYAKSAGRYTAPASDALSGLSDANTVDGWARDAVNWAVTNKVMGNGGYVAGTSDISRAEVATMGVNYQPKVL